MKRMMESPFRVASIDPFLGPHTRLLNDTRQNTVTDASEADALLGRYDKVPRFLEGALLVHRKAADLGQSPALASVTRVISQLDGYLNSDIDDDPFLALRVPDDDNDWREKAEVRVMNSIRPAFVEYRDGLKEHIAPVSRPDEHCGLTWMSGGDQIYADLIEQYVQLPMSAQEIHDIGMHWATEINAAEWVEIGERAFGLSTLEEIFERLHSDPELRFSSEDEMLEHARRALERAWAAVDDWFGHRPATTCDLRFTSRLRLMARDQGGISSTLTSQRSAISSSTSRSISTKASPGTISIVRWQPNWRASRRSDATRRSMHTRRDGVSTASALQTKWACIRRMWIGWG
jgi:uncharacterized protein (DUF885 family)